jgi:hypothetical protein
MDNFLGKEATCHVTRDKVIRFVSRGAAYVIKIIRFLIKITIRRQFQIAA